MTYSFEKTNIKGFYHVFLGMKFIGMAAKRPDPRGYWTFQPQGKDTLLQTFKTKNDIARWAATFNCAPRE